MLSSRAKRGGGAVVTGRHEATLNIGLASDGKLEHETVAHESAANHSAKKAALVKPGEHSNDKLSEPQSHQVMESPE